jgi:hypothetical protein
MKVFREECAPLKGQGARVKIRRKSWLKQLKVAVSTKASMPSGSSPQNSRTNFVDLHRSFYNFGNLWNFLKIAYNQGDQKTVKLLQPAPKFSCKMARWGRVTFFQIKCLYCLSCIKISTKVSRAITPGKYKGLEGKFNDVPWFATIIFDNVNSISEVEPAANGAKGLHLRDPRRA